MQPTRPAMAIAFFKASMLRSSKLITVIQSQSNILHIRGVFKKTRPPLILVSTRPEETPQDVANLEKYVNDIRKRDWVDLRMYGGGIHYGISIDFEKVKVRRVESEGDILFLARQGGHGGDIGAWVEKAMSGGKLGFSPVTTGKRAVKAENVPLKAGISKTIRLLPPPPEDRRRHVPLKDGAPGCFVYSPIKAATPQIKISGGTMTFNSGLWEAEGLAAKRAPPHPVTPPGVSNVSHPIKLNSSVPHFDLAHQEYELSEFHKIKHEAAAEASTTEARQVAQMAEQPNAFQINNDQAWESAEEKPRFVPKGITGVEFRKKVEAVTEKVTANPNIEFRKDPKSVEQDSTAERYANQVGDPYKSPIVKKKPRTAIKFLRHNSIAKYPQPDRDSPSIQRYATAVPKPLVRKFEASPIVSIGLIRKHYCNV